MALLPSDAQQPVVKGFYNQYTRGEITEETFWQGVGQANNRQLREDFLNAFVFDDDMPDVIDALSKKYALSILSNLARDWGETLIDKFQFEQTFSPIIISGAVACEKPHKRIYEILIEQSQLPAEQILFIDDRLENLATAHALGMTTVHYQREADSCDYQADYCITKLGDLLNVL
ncbi:MAG: HAD-IA family hydrolase [Mariprofundus sp.]|nr:HAD-IA family hydrolase [Mariprofundus sp.]